MRLPGLAVAALTAVTLTGCAATTPAPEPEAVAALRSQYPATVAGRSTTQVGDDIAATCRDMTAGLKGEPLLQQIQTRFGTGTRLGAVEFRRIIWGQACGDVPFPG